MTPETKPINIKQLKMKSEYALLESVRDELRMIRKLLDTTCRFEESSIAKPEPKPKEREVAESDDGSHLRVTTSESEPKPIPVALPADVVNWKPENLEWQTCESKSGKGPYERHPFIDQPVQSTPDYHNLREAILAVQKTGKHVLGHKESGCYYWLSEDTNVIMRRKSKW